MSWPSEILGAGAITNAGFGLRDHARAAIQALSGDVQERTVYTCLGWREIDGSWVYLHAAGAVGPVGTVYRAGETHLVDGLTRFELPEAPEGQALQQAVRASFRMLDVAPDTVTVAILAAAYRAVLGEIDFGLHVSGPTGAGKTELLALVQQHYGPAMDARHLPASWSSTGNALEALAFAAKDAVLAVDDYAPTGSAADVARLQGTAERLFRAQGNGSGRARMRADTSLRPARAPRGLILSTGEDVPLGQSLRARVLVLELGPTDLDWAALGSCQADAANGLYAAAMAGFVQWVARGCRRAESGRAPTSCNSAKKPTSWAAIVAPRRSSPAWVRVCVGSSTSHRRSVLSPRWRPPPSGSVGGPHSSRLLPCNSTSMRAATRSWPSVACWRRPSHRARPT